MEIRLTRRRSATPVDGAIGGLFATFPMTAVMLLGHRLLPRPERYPLPPEQITEEVVDRVGVVELEAPGPGQGVVTGFAHFGYGAAGGALYAPLSGRLPLPAALSGPLFGLLVWAVSYLGWLPAVDLLPPATEHPARRSLVMILAHLVWGGALAWFLEGRARR